VDGVVAAARLVARTQNQWKNKELLPTPALGGRTSYLFPSLSVGSCLYLLALKHKQKGRTESSPASVCHPLARRLNLC